MRLARQYLWIPAADCDPPHGLDMAPGGRDDLKVADLERQFRAGGFDPSMPALVGYPLDGRVQLLSGTHRHMAASRIEGFLLPVTLFLQSEVQTVWGTDRWVALIEDVPVSKLELRPVQEGGAAPSVDDQVDLGRDVW